MTHNSSVKIQENSKIQIEKERSQAAASAELAKCAISNNFDMGKFFQLNNLFCNAMVEVVQQLDNVRYAKYQSRAEITDELIERTISDNKEHVEMMKVLLSRAAPNISHLWRKQRIINIAIKNKFNVPAFNNVLGLTSKTLRKILQNAKKYESVADLKACIIKEIAINNKEKKAMVNVALSCFKKTFRKVCLRCLVPQIQADKSHNSCSKIQ